MELEPEGIGCVSMGEYFLFQLMKKGIHVPDAFRDLCMNHLEDITEMTFVQIAHMIHASFQEVKRWVRVPGVRLSRIQSGIPGKAALWKP